MMETLAYDNEIQLSYMCLRNIGNSYGLTAGFSLSVSRCVVLLSIHVKNDSSRKLTGVHLVVDLG